MFFFNLLMDFFSTLIGLLFSWLGVFFVVLAGLGFLIFLIKRNKNRKWFVQKIIIYAICYILLIPLSYKILLFDLFTPSKVDISPVYNLVEIADARLISQENFENLASLIEESETFTWFNSQNNHNYSFAYEYNPNPDPNRNRVYARIEMYHYLNNTQAKERFSSKEKNKQLVLISDNLAINLFHSEMVRSTMFEAANLRKYTITYILFNNIVICVSEDTSFSKACKPSSEAIKVLCGIFRQGLIEDNQ